MKQEHSLNPTTGITGTSAIDHRLRIKMELSCDEYVLAEYLISQLFNGSSGLMRNCYKETGFNVDQCVPICHRLETKGYITVLGGTLIKPTALLRSHFRYDEYFTQLYRLFQQLRSPLGIGNKEKCRRNYFKCIKIIPGATLLEKARQYAELKKGTEPAYILQLETYLNPKEQRWNDNHRQSSDKGSAITIIDI